MEDADDADNSLSQSEQLDLEERLSTNTKSATTIPAIESTEDDTESQITTRGAFKGTDDNIQYGKQDEQSSRYLTTMRPTSDTLFTDLSLFAGSVSDGQAYGQVPLQPPPPSSSPLPRTRSSIGSSQPIPKWQRSVIWRAWLQGKGMIMVIVSQFFGSSMNVMTQVLERDGAHGKAMHPFQVCTDGKCYNI